MAQNGLNEKFGNMHAYPVDFQVTGGVLFREQIREGPIPDPRAAVRVADQALRARWVAVLGFLGRFQQAAPPERARGRESENERTSTTDQNNKRKV